MPADTDATTLPPLVASLQEEGKKARVVFNFCDQAFIRKIEKLAQQVPREYDIIQAFRAFLADPSRTVSPFWFVERFDKYHKRVAIPSREQPALKPLIVDDPRTPDGLGVFRECAARGDKWAAHMLAVAQEACHG